MENRNFADETRLFIFCVTIKIEREMKKMFLAAAAVAAMTLSSCGIATTTSNNLTETKVVLSENNFRVVGQAYGEAKAKYVFFIGGLKKEALMNNAINEMSKNAHLTGAQTLTNVTTHMAVKMITPIYIEVTCNATANIVEFK